MIVGIAVVVVLLLVASIFGYFALTQKSGPVLQAQLPEAKADDLLTAGRSNNELLIDSRIIDAGLERDNKQKETSEKTLADSRLPVGDGVTTSTTVEAERLSRLQTEYIAEADRRLVALEAAGKQVEDLQEGQKAALRKVIGDETTLLTGLKAKAAAETTIEAFLADRDLLDKQYVNYLLAISRPPMLLWANDQAVLLEKINVLGGKLQERLNEGSNSGNTTAAAQTMLNTYQTNKGTAKDSNQAAVKSLIAVKVDSYEANKAVLVNYNAQLVSANTQIKTSAQTGADIIKQIRAFK